MRHFDFAAVLVIVLSALPRFVTAGQLHATVEVEEDVYSYRGADNGAGPMWCHGGTSIVRVGERVFASGLETLADAKPLNNCVPLLYCRGENGWTLAYRGTGRTREPSPMAAFPGGRVFLSANPTLTKPDVYSGPSEPRVLEFSASDPAAPPRSLLPKWDGAPRFSEHSYRTFVADADRGELLLIQNIGYTHAEWSYRNASGAWSAQGQLVWPWGADYETPQPIRVCYPAVALKNKAVYFCGVSDIQEPKRAWRDYKRELTGRKWDYDFRRLFYTWSDDITVGTFHDWVEVSSREKTGGNVFPADLYVAPNGDVFVLWTERALDERLRTKFFPEEKQRHSLEYAIVRDGKVTLRVALVEGGEALGGERPGWGRFHVSEDGRLFVLYYVGGRDEDGHTLSENRITEIHPGGGHGKPVVLELKRPLSSFFTATVRAGSRPSNLIDVLGDTGGTLRYFRVRLSDKRRS